MRCTLSSDEKGKCRKKVTSARANDVVSSSPRVLAHLHRTHKNAIINLADAFSERHSLNRRQKQEQEESYTSTHFHYLRRNRGRSKFFFWQKNNAVVQGGKNNMRRTSVRRSYTTYLFFFLWRFLRKRFLRLCVAILWRLRFFPQGISVSPKRLYDS